MGDPAANRHGGPVVASVEGVDVIDCADCGFRHIDPLPAPEVLKAFYEDAFYQQEKTDYLAEAGEDLPWLMRLFADRFERIEAAVPDRAGGGARGTVLDVGTGPGMFLDAGAERGWVCVGVEPSPDAAAYARGRGHDVRRGFFTPELVADAAPFDAVHMSEVLEHVLDPARLLEDAWTVLKPGGVLCVSAPNDFNPLQMTLYESGAQRPWWIVPTHHLNYFDFDSLERVIGRTGFDCLGRDATFPMEMFLLMGHDYIGNSTLGREMHGRRKAFDLAFAGAGPVGDEARRAFYGALATAGLGRLAVVVARKPSSGGRIA